VSHSTVDRPAWALRIQRERKARGWTQLQAIGMLRLHSGTALPDDTNLLRMWKNWESGRHRPRAENQVAIAAMFAASSAAIFGPDESLSRSPLRLEAPTEEAALELVERLRHSDIDSAALDTLAITVERLCSEYAFMPSAELRHEALTWLARLDTFRDHRPSLAELREIMVLAGWLTLLVGCLEYDMSMHAHAEASRRSALLIGRDTGHGAIEAWAHEMRSWFALTQGRYREVVEAARQGRVAAPRESVAVQLAAQEAKAWARVGDRRQVELALDAGRTLLEALPYPDNIQNHFTVDPDKFDFYAMDCYRRAGENTFASLHAEEVIRKSTEPDGTARSPMRVAEAQLTLGIVAAREGDLDRAITIGTGALDIPRRSLPSLMLVGQELAMELNARFTNERAAEPYLERIRTLAR